MEKLETLTQKLKRIFANYPGNPEPRYECPWCQDSGFVLCYLEDGINYPIKFADTLRVQRERRGKNYITCSACRFCEAGTYVGRPTAGGLKAAEQWVRENVTSTVSLRGTYEKAEQEGFSEEMINQAFRRLGIRKHKVAGRWICEPPPSPT